MPFTFWIFFMVVSPFSPYVFGCSVFFYLSKGVHMGSTHFWAFLMPFTFWIFFMVVSPFSPYVLVARSFLLPVKRGAHWVNPFLGFLDSLGFIFQCFLHGQSPFLNF